MARPGPRGRGPNHESRITFLPFSPKKWSGYLRRPQAESRKLGPARPEGQGPESRIPNPESRFCHFRQKNGPGTSEDRKPNPESLARPGPRGPNHESRIPNHVSAIFAKKMVRVPPKTASRIPKAWPGPARGQHRLSDPIDYPIGTPVRSYIRSLNLSWGAGARITNPESRITFLPFSPKKWSGYLRRPQAESRKLGPARPEGQGPESRIPNPESRFCHFRQKNGPGTSEDRKPNPESLARPGPRGRAPNHESRITFLPFSPKKWSGYLRRPQAESRKLGPARPEGQGPESRIPNHVSAIFANKMVRAPPKTASRIPKAWPGPARGAGARIPNPESRFCHFRQKNGLGTSEDRKPNPESLARPGPRGPNHESRIPNHVSAIFAKKMVRVPPKTASRIPKAWPGPARGAGARITNPESRFCHFRQKNGPGTSEDRKPNPESLARPGPRNRGPNHESRIPNHVSAIFAKKMVRVPPKTASRIPKAWPGPARGAGARIPNHVSAIFAKKMVRVPPKTASRVPKAWPGPARGAGARITNPESRFCHFRQITKM